MKTLISKGLMSRSAAYVTDNWLHFFTSTNDEVSLYFSRGTVQRIEFNPDAKLPLRLMMDRFGPPAAVFVETEGEHEDCHVSHLYYPHQGLRIEAAECQDLRHAARLANGNIMPDTPVVILALVDAATNVEALFQQLDLSDTESERLTGNIVEWSGYGYYPP